jgi:hypothetical protein
VLGVEGELRVHLVLDVPRLGVRHVVQRLRLVEAEVHLAGAGEPGSDVQKPTLVLRVVRDVAGHLCAWTDERHVTEEHVHQLGELIELRPAQMGADARHPRVALTADEGTGWTVGAHGPQLDDAERPAGASDAFLQEEGGARAVQPDCQREHHQQRKQQQQGDRRHEDVDEPAPPRVGPAPWVRHHNVSRRTMSGSAARRPTTLPQYDARSASAVSDRGCGYSRSSEP